MAKRKTSRATLSQGSLRLKIEGKEVTLSRVTEVLSVWSALLREVAKDVVGEREPVRYVITKARGGSFDIQVRPQPMRPNIPDREMPRIAKAVQRGLRTLERHPKRPQYFSDLALEKAKELAEYIGRDVPSLRVGNGAATEVSLSKKLIENVDKLIGPHYESIGTVEGELQGLIVHGRQRFLVYDALTGRQVSCYFSDRITWQEIFQAFGKRVSATGWVRSRRTGEKISIDVSRLRVFPPEEALPSPEKVLGILRGRD